MQTRRLPLDIAPSALFRALARKERPFFIDAGRPWGNEWVSSMGFGPRMQFRAGPDDARAPLAALDATLKPLAPSSSARAAPRPVPFAGGAVVALAYEAARTMEPAVRRRAAAPATPYLALAIYDAVVAYDHRRHAYVAASWHLDARALARYADEVCDAAAEAACTARSAASDSALGAPLPVTCNVDRDAYTDGVERIQRYLAAGDVYQVNLSMRLRTPADGSPLDLYGALRAAQPVPFGAYVDAGHEQLLSNSPELFLRRRGERIETAPIKGTRPRGRTPAEDARLADELRSAAKDRAEHVMIVDLERNDLGRVCRTGSIRVERYAELASFRTLHHLVSTVTGSIAPAVTTGDLLHATFPGGSITGAPKIRAMEIIDEIERVPRGFYTGTLGWIDASGDLDLNVAIRTAVANDEGLAYHVGSGIVADSDPDREYAESILKAAAFLRALGMTAPDGGDAALPVPSSLE